MDANERVREMIIKKMKYGNYTIKPCPFCGRTPKIQSKEFFDELQDEDTNGYACLSMHCECDTDMYEHTHEEHNYYIRAFMLVEKWNGRVYNNVQM